MSENTPAKLLPPPNVFSRLCHLAALSKEGKTKAAVDNVVLTILAINRAFSASTAEQVVDAINTYFSLPLRVDAVQSSVDTHLSNGRLIRDRVTKTLGLSANIRAEIEDHISEANRLEQEVRDQWLQSLAGIDSLAPETHEQLWKALGVYMAQAFQRHGAETISLLDPSIASREDEKGSLATYLDSAVKSSCKNIPYEDAVRLISDFFIQPPHNRTRYLAQLLDGTFTYFALTFDQFTSTYLKEGLSPLSLFLDTNFIFALLDISESHLKDVSLELIEVIGKQKLPFKLYYHEETLKELRRVIGSAGDDLKARRWPQTMSRAAIQAGVLQGITRKYHMVNAEIPTDPEVFLSKYEHIEELLNDAGLTIYRAISNRALDEQRHLLVAEYKQFVDSHRPTPRPYEALNHDMAVWQTVLKTRKKSSMVFGVGAYFLTMDYLLYRFDSLRLRKRDDLGVVILSNQFMQLLRPFVPTNPDIDESFVEIFALPELRTVVRDYATTSMKVFSYLSTFADMNEPTAVRILTDQVLSGKLRDLKEDSKDFDDLIDNEIAKENTLLQKQADKLKADVASADQKAQAFKKMALEKQTDLQRLEGEKRLALEAGDNAQRKAIAAELRAEEAERNLQRLSAENGRVISDHGKAIEELKGQLGTYALIARIFGGVLFTIVGLTAILLFSVFGTWTWLDSHPNRLGLYTSAVLTVVCFGWAIADEKRRNIALVALFAPILIAVITMLGK